MSIADKQTYLSEIVRILQSHWPENRRVNIVCHGHSVPAGYFATPRVDTFNAYPHLLHRGLKDRFPFALINVIVTAIGGENSRSGLARFEAEVLCHRPDVVTIDYGLNDRGIGLEAAGGNWRGMIESALSEEVKLILLTPTSDVTQRRDYAGEDAGELRQHAGQVRGLAAEYEVGLVDSLDAFDRYQSEGDLSDLLSWSNHPNRRGHELVTRRLMRWFPAG